MSSVFQVGCITMRFSEDGPMIPDELLNARDEGRVVFFCGAGVSQARAGLPDFFGLAEKVIQELGAPADGDARKVLAKAHELGDELNVSGLISADRVFGLLEKEFAISDIQVAVARSLTPAAEADLSAHQMLLRLARTPDLKTQLVTTNFDRLFEKCDDNCAVFQPPRLPSPSRYDDLDGIVYLHGRVDDENGGADGDGFVLSSSEFGHAYLSVGWATEFFLEIVARYVVVFVGYSADDPPINYLLEGLYRKVDPSRHIFAFHASESDEIRARWLHKGVEAISYPKTDEHRALWETLELWAQRADDPISWRSTVVDSAMNGPEELTPYQRGQVAHIVSSHQGAREFGERKPAASWLCVFDPTCRYGRPGKSKWSDPESPTVDPFTLYGLDSDITPERIDPNHSYGNRDIPSDAWDAFTANDLDRQELSSQHFARLRGHNASSFPLLPRRLGCLGTWIANVASEPATLRWAVRQESLHPAVRQRINWQLDQHHDQFAPTILRAWQYLIESWDRADEPAERDWYGLERKLRREGWNSSNVRRFISVTRPYLKAMPPLMPTPTPPTDTAHLRIRELLRLEVECLVPPQNAKITDDWMERVIQGLRKNLEFAVDLCDEVDDVHLHQICPIIPDDRPDISNFQRTRGLSGYVIRFSELFDRLIELSISKAQRELSIWRRDDAVFARLRFWAAGKPEVATAESFCKVVNDLSDDVFWGSYHQRDLLLVLAQRWSVLPTELRRDIEDRILEGPPKWKNEEDSQYQERKAWSTLNRLQWFADNNCEFSFDLGAELAARRPFAPKWKPEYAKHAADSRQTRGGTVTTDTEYSVLLHTPVDFILSKAQELSGRTDGNFLEKRDPFAGLCADRPRRAFLALVHAARRNHYPEWAWKKFLNSPARENDEPKLRAAVAERMCRIPDDALKQLLYASTEWLEKTGKLLSSSQPTVFDRTVIRLIDIIQREPQEADSAVLGGGNDRDWATAALNSPVGNVAMSIVQDSRLEAMDGPIDSTTSWLAHLVRLLELSEDLRRHAIAILTHHLVWFHQLTPDWTERHLLSIIHSEDMADREAFWSGFLWNPVVTPNLFHRVKPALLEFSKQRDASREGHVQAIAYLIFRGWIAAAPTEENRQVSNDEFRDVLLQGGDILRSQVLWQVEQWLNNADKSELDEKLVLALELFRDVWPRQMAVKSPQMSSHLVHLLLSSRPVFSRLAEVVLPLLTKIQHRHDLYLPEEQQEEIVNENPGLLLRVLHTVLSDDVTDWPYGTAGVLDRIGEVSGDLRSNPQLRELLRRWNAR